MLQISQINNSCLVVYKQGVAGAIGAIYKTGGYKPTNDFGSQAPLTSANLREIADKCDEFAKS